MSLVDDFANTVANNPYAQGITSFAQNNPVTKFVLGSAMNVANDIGAGIAGQNTNKNLNSMNQTATDLENKAYSTSDPNLKKAILNQANQVRQGLSDTAQQSAQTYSPDVNQNPLIRAPMAASQIVSTGDIAAHPLSTLKSAADVVAHPLKTIQNAAQGVSDFASNPTEFIKNLPWDAEHSFKLEGGDNTLTRMGNRVLAGQFKGAGKVVDNPAGVMGDLHEYGLSAPEEIHNAAGVVTGPEGIGNKIVTRAVKMAPNINVGEITDDAGNIVKPGLLDTAKTLMDNEDLIQPNTEQRILKGISQSIQKSALPHYEGNITGGDPEQMLSTLRTWEAKANAPASTDDAQAAKRVYQGLANELKQRIFVDSGVDQMLPRSLMTPEEYQALQKVGNGKIADDIANAPSIQDVRSLQSRFVKGSQMYNQAAKSASAGINLPESIGAASSAVTGNPLGMGMAVSQTQPGKNLVGNAFHAIGGLNSGGVQFGADVLGQGIPKVAENSASMRLSGPSNQQNGQNNGYNPSHSPSIPQNGSQGQPKYPVTAPWSSGLAIPPQQIAQQEADLQQKIEQAKLYDPQTANTLNGQLMALKTKEAAQKPLIDNYTQTATTTGVAERAANLALQAPPDPGQFSKWYDAVKKGLNPKYAQLTQALNYLQKISPGADFSNIKDGQTLQAAIDQVANNATQSYNTFLNSYTGSPQTGQAGNWQIPQQPPPQPTQQMTPFQQANANFHFGKSGENMPSF